MANSSPPRTELSEGQGLSQILFDLATGEDDARLCRDIPDSQCREEPQCFTLQVIAQALSKSGDVLADAKVVLPWLLGSVGAPVFLVGLLVPIRESLALLPQILVGGVIRRFALRKGFWVAASLIEGLCIIAMGLIALLGVRGTTAGWTIVGLLVVFSLARGIASIAAKDTLGKTVSKGRRGRVSGYAATASGLVASAVGLYFVLGPAAGRPDWLLYALIVAAGCCWVAAAATFHLIPEHPGATEGGRGLGDLVRDQLRILLDDRELQKFLLARTLMIATALVGPVYVSLAQQGMGSALDGLGWLVIASGLAAALSSTFWGVLSDTSSRLTMALAAGIAALLGFAVLGSLTLFPSLKDSFVFYAAVLFILGIAHSGVRIGRKTQVVDIAGGDRKAEYVALSNTLIGVLLLILGGLTGILMSLGLELAIGMLSALSLLGAAAALTLKNAQA